MEIDWKSPIAVGNDQLPSVVSNLLQSGVKFFLHQRNQIPLPVEQLVNKNKHFSSHFVDGNAVDSGQNDVNVDELTPRERIKFIGAQRKHLQAQLKRKRIVEKICKQEEVVVTAIKECLQVLDFQMLNNFQNLHAIGLFFGTSAQSAKEVIFFDISRTLRNSMQLKVENSNRTTEEQGHPKFTDLKEFSTLTKSFYKGIIMTDEFCDFTAKNLPSTRSHICILSTKELVTFSETPENSVVMLDNPDVFMDFLTSQVSETSELTDSVPEIKAKFNKKKKVLKIKIDIPTSKRNTNTDAHPNSPNIKDIPFESLFCYQIPLRLKGITSCKNNLM